MADKYIRARVSDESKAGWEAFVKTRRIRYLTELVEALGLMFAEDLNAKTLDLDELVSRAWDLVNGEGLDRD